MKFVVKHFSELTTRELFEIYKVRVAVFVVEQKCAYQEVDDMDREAYHFWFENDDGIEAYLRLMPAGVARAEVSLGRVIAVKRRCGLGTKIVAEGIRFAKEKLGASEIVIEAQTYVKKMYESLVLERNRRNS